MEKKEHWIRKTKLGLCIQKNENLRKIASIIVVIGVVLLIISAISGFANLDTASTHLAGVQGVSANIKQFESEIMKYRIQAFGSIIVAILLWYYGKKIVEKKE